MSNGFLDIFIIMTCLSQNKAKFKYLAIARNYGCYLEGFYLKDIDN